MQGLIVLMLLATIFVAFINQDVAIVLLNISFLLLVIETIRCFIDYIEFNKIIKESKKHEKDF
mgnify:CR=1 FL=1